MRFLFASVWVVLPLLAVAVGCSRGAGEGAGLEGGPMFADPCAAPAAAMEGMGGKGAACAGAGAACGGAAADTDDSNSYSTLQSAVEPPRTWADRIPSGRTAPRSGSRPGPRPKQEAWKRSSVMPNASKLSVGDKDDLPMEAMDVSVHVDGYRARVTLDMFFRNDRETQLQGKFSLRLPNGASPYYVAFGETKLEEAVFEGSVPLSIPDIREQRKENWEQPKEGRMVPRTKAAHAYAKTVRKQIDPALMEWSGAGVFSTRVYPLMPGKLHQVVVGYDVDLVRLGEDLLYRLDLPEGVGDLEVNLSVAGGGADLEIKPAVTPKEGRYHWRNPKERTIFARWRDAGNIMLRGDDPETGPRFAAQIRPSLNETPGGAKERAVFLVDVSLSANPDQFNVQLKLLDAILAENRSEIREFALGFFNVETFWWRKGFRENTAENAENALAYAESLSLEGATDVGQAFRDLRNRCSGAFDVFLLSDGAVTWGEDDLYALSRGLGDDHALFAYATGLAGSDRRALSHLARESGGAVFAVTSEDALSKAAVAHRKRPWQLKGVAVEGGSDLVLAGRPTTIFPGQRLSIAGRGRPADGARVVLTMEQDGNTQTVKTQIDRHIPSTLAARIYGQIAVAQLEDVARDDAVARAYATQYRIVGKTCSLLMLDTEEDYKRFGIKPEEDAYLIEKQEASKVVAEALAAHGDSLGDPKRRFLRWLESLESAEHVKVKVVDSLRLALAEMPASHFEVHTAALEAESRRTVGVSSAYRRALEKRSFTYEQLTREAARRMKDGRSDDGLKVLSTLIEHHPGDLVLARDVAFTLMEWGMDGQAYGLLRRVVEKRPYEYPTYYAVALALEKLRKIDLSIVFYELAMSVENSRFGDLSLIVAFDYLRLLRQIERGQRQTSVPSFAKARLKTVSEKPVVKEADLVLVMAWNTDRTDVDLHVKDPRGEECFYSHPDTKIGGHLTTDVTGGFGPEMFVLKNAVPGTYLAEAKYYASDATATGTRSKVYVTLYQDWGRENERVLRKTITLSQKGERQRIATVRRR